jgi:hypothetical protein
MRKSDLQFANCKPECDYKEKNDQSGSPRSNKKILLGFVAGEDYFEWFLISTLYIAGVRFTVNHKAFTIL